MGGDFAGRVGCLALNHERASESFDDLGAEAILEGRVIQMTCGNGEDIADSDVAPCNHSRVNPTTTCK